MKSINSLIALSALAASASSFGAASVIDMPRYSPEAMPRKPRKHSRGIGKHQPSGSKLARKAKEGTIGIARLR